MSDPPAGDEWQVRMARPRPGRPEQPLRPPEIGALLVEAMLARENWLEDAEYKKTVPNHFVVELPPEAFTRHYRPLEARLCQQWRTRLLNHLATTNSRQGRREYRFAGQVVVELRPATDLDIGHLRIRSRLHPDPAEAQPPTVLPACLELLPEGRQWRLREGRTTIGRDPGCDIYLENARVQELRLVSGRHAYLHCLDGVCRIFDGSPDGQPSINGTFVNGRPVPPGGQVLQDGDTLILAALRPQEANLQTPGVVGLRFRARCE